MAEENANGQIDIFREIYRTDGAGSSLSSHDYEYLDTEPKTSTRYYRLKQVDFDGTYTYTDIKALDFKKEAAVINIYPIPFKEELQIMVEGKAGASLKIRISDIAGRTIYQQTSQVETEGIHQETIYMDAQTPPGIYVIEVNIDGLLHNKKIIKNWILNK